MMEERTTGELIQKLGADVEKCHGLLCDVLDADEYDEDGKETAEYEFHARNLIRSILAYIEAVTYSVKVSCVYKCMENDVEVTDHERYLSVEIDSALNDKGEVIERSAKIRLSSNVRFAFNLLEKSSGKPTSFDPKSEWWSCLKETIKVRDRLTHPRLASDIDVTGDEVLKALRAMKGFEEVLMHKNEE